MLSFLLLLLNLVVGCFAQSDCEICASGLTDQQFRDSFVAGQSGNLDVTDADDYTTTYPDVLVPVASVTYMPPTPAPSPPIPSPILFTSSPYAPATAFPTPPPNYDECVQRKEAFDDQECCLVSVLDALYNNCTIEADWFQEYCDCI